MQKVANAECGMDVLCVVRRGVEEFFVAYGLFVAHRLVRRVSASRDTSAFVAERAFSDSSA